MHTHTHKRTHARADTNAHTHAHTHTYTRTHTHQNKVARHTHTHADTPHDRHTHADTHADTHMTRTEGSTPPHVRQPGKGDDGGGRAEERERRGAWCIVRVFPPITPFFLCFLFILSFFLSWVSSGNYACIYMSDKNAFICH